MRLFTSGARNVVVLLLTSISVLYAVLSTSFWTDMSQALAPDGSSYAQRRIRFGFGGFPVDEIVEGLDAVLPATARIALGPTLARDPFLRQRLTEALYPRVVDEAAPNTLGLADAASFEGAPGGRERKLAELPSGQVVHLSGPLSSPTPAPAPAPAPAPEELDLAWGKYLGAVASLMGIGMATLWMFGRIRHEAVGPPDPVLSPLMALLVGATSIGLLSSMKTWLQIALPWSVSSTAGLLAFVWGAAWLGARGELPLARLVRDTAVRLGRRPENLVAAALALALLVRMALFPIAMWDGRSIWLFHGKQVFLNDLFTSADVKHPDAQWSHTAYPLLLPGLFAHFCSLGSAFNERIAALGAGTFFATIFGILWALGRRAVGRSGGAALAICAFLSLEGLVSGGYADGYVATLLLTQVLAFSMSRFEGLGWIAALAASLVKQEGAIFAAIIAAFFVCSRRSAKRRFVRRFGPFVVFAPAVAHQLWAATMGLEGDFARIRWSEALLDPGARLALILPSAWDALGNYPALAIGAAGLALTIALLGTRASGSADGARVALGSALSMLVFIGFVFLVTPADLRWHLDTALDRLLLHPALLLCAAPLLLLAEADREPPEPAIGKTPPQIFQ